MKLEDFAAKSALLERNYKDLVKIICTHFEIDIPVFDIRDDCPSNQTPTRAVLLLTNNKLSYSFELLGNNSSGNSGGFVYWSWDKNYLEDDNYLLVT